MRATHRFANMFREAGGEQEGELASPLDDILARIPSQTFVWLAWASVFGALGLWITGRRRAASFVGLWAPTLLIHGIYAKMVRQTEHGAYDRTAR